VQQEDRGQVTSSYRTEGPSRCHGTLAATELGIKTFPTQGRHLRRGGPALDVALWDSDPAELDLTITG
jgi:hypothetical protein